MHTNVKVIAWECSLSRKYHFNEIFVGKRRAPVLIQRVNQTETLMHSHDFNELVFILSGSAIHEVGKMKYKMRPGDFFLIDTKTKHAYKNCQSLKLVNVLIQERFLAHRKKMLADLKGFKILFSHDAYGSFVRPPNLGGPRLEESLILVNKIERELFESDSASNEIQSLLTTELLITACRFAELKGGKTGSLWPNIEKALSYIQDHFNEKTDVEKLCALASMSERSFMRYFIRITGYSPIQYLLKTRILRACQILRETDNPLSAISASCGFDDTNYFSRSFKKITGLTPYVFRKRSNFKIQF